MKRIALAVFAVLLSGISVGQDKFPPKVVRVTGTAEVKVVPDRVVLEIGVEKQSPSATTAKQAVDAVSRKVLAALRANGIEEKDIKTTYLSLQPQFDYRSGMKISYFYAEQTISVTERDISKLDTLLDAVIRAGGNRIDSIEYQSSDLRKYRDQAREMAVKAAREKAEALAHALGQEIGKPYSIEELAQPNYQYFGGLMANVSLETADKARAPSGPSAATGERTITASVNVAFDLQ